jgi:hypothetical protein
VPAARDYRTHLIVGGLLAFVSTLLPFLALAAGALGAWVWANGAAGQRRQGALLVLASVLAGGIGIWVYAVACQLPNLAQACG